MLSFIMLFWSKEMVPLTYSQSFKSWLFSSCKEPTAPQRDQAQRERKKIVQTGRVGEGGEEEGSLKVQTPRDRCSFRKTFQKPILLLPFHNTPLVYCAPLKCPAHRLEAKQSHKKEAPTIREHILIYICNTMVDTWRKTQGAAIFYEMGGGADQLEKKKFCI